LGTSHTNDRGVSHVAKRYTEEAFRVGDVRVGINKYKIIMLCLSGTVVTAYGGIVMFACKNLHNVGVVLCNANSIVE